MKKKYGDTIEAILEHKENLEKELRQLQSLESDIESVALEKKTVESLLEEESLRLTNLRRTSASTLENKIQQELFNLNFSDVLVSVDFKEKKEYSPDGRDDVEFLISTNKGERLKPLNKIASGGEMSRIMLAFKRPRVGDNWNSRHTVEANAVDFGRAVAEEMDVGRESERPVDVVSLEEDVCNRIEVVVAGNDDELDVGVRRRPFAETLVDPLFLVVDVPRAASPQRRDVARKNDDVRPRRVKPVKVPVQIRCRHDTHDHYPPLCIADPLQLLETL